MNNSEKDNSQKVKIIIKKAADDLIYLLCCAFNEEVPSADRCEKMNLPNVYRLASMHFLAAAAAYALEQVMELPHEFDQAKKKAIRKLSLFEIERLAVLGELEKAGIWYLPLKGIVLGKYYPKTAMREMSDNDILIDSQKSVEVKSIMERLGFVCERFGDYNHDEYSKLPSVEFEMHTTLFAKNEVPEIFDYYSNIKDKLIRGKGMDYKMSNEDFYIYLIAHTYKHYAFSGTGLRSLADIYIFLKITGDSLDTDYIAYELDKLDLSDFERKIKNLSNKIFTIQALDKEEEKLLDYFIFSFAYGNADNDEYNQYARMLNYDDSKKSKKKYFKNRFFINEAQIADRYPFFYKHKVLYPFLFVFRVFRGLICHPKKLFEEYKNIKKFKNDGRN